MWILTYLSFWIGYLLLNLGSKNNLIKKNRKIEDNIFLHWRKWNSIKRGDRWGLWYSGQLWRIAWLQIILMNNMITISTRMRWSTQLDWENKESLNVQINDLRRKMDLYSVWMYELEKIESFNKFRD